nr:ribonuclease H-like domain-containing protein [Tanacetum cinerariifolium]
SSDDKTSKLDLGNPLHLQTSDFNSNTTIPVKFTGVENYRVWAAAMKLAINTRNKTRFLDGTCLKSTYANAPLSNQWERCNSIVLSWLLNSDSEELFLGQIYSNNASEVSHTINRCLDIIGYPPGYNKNTGPKSNGTRTFNANSVSSSSEKGASLSFTNEQMIKMNLINEAPSGNLQANMAYRVTLGWIINSGANQHMTISKLNMFEVIDITDLNLTDDFVTSMGKTSTSEGNVHINSKSPAQGNLPQNISQGSKKYGLEKYVTYTNLNTSIYSFSINLNKSSEPTSYFEAVKNPNWIEAMNNEIEALKRNNTWIVCDLPKGRKAIRSKWLWRIKYKSTGEIKRYKARVVARALVRGKDLITWKPLVLWLKCLLLGSKFDYSLFTKNSDNVFIILLVYVDDIVVTENSVNEIENFKQFLKSKFQIKDLGKLKYFLGIEVLDNKDSIYLSQRKYCLELLHEFDLLAAKHVDTPLPENATLNHTEFNDEHLLVNVSNYKRLVGKLIYLTNTMPDIAYVVHCLSHYMHSPLNSHLDVAIKVLRYLKGSLRSGIQINKTGNLKLRAYADSDWA